MIPKLLRAETHTPYQRKRVCSPLRFVCVCVWLPRESPSALLLANLCLVNPSRGSLTRDVLLSVVSLLSLHTHSHIHTLTNAHTRTVKVVYQYIWMSLFAT